MCLDPADASPKGAGSPSVNVEARGEGGISLPPLIVLVLLPVLVPRFGQGTSSAEDEEEAETVRRRFHPTNYSSGQGVGPSLR